MTQKRLKVQINAMRIPSEDGTIKAYLPVIISLLEMFFQTLSVMHQLFRNGKRAKVLYFFTSLSIAELFGVYQPKYKTELIQTKNNIYLVVTTLVLRSITELKILKE